MVSNVLFSSEKTEWGTPQWFFNRLDKEFHFTLDPCASHENHKCETYFTIDDDGLSKPWKGHTVFMNPPYGTRIIDQWMAKAEWESYFNGVIAVCLVPSRTDTKWWHNYAMLAHEIRLVKGRMKFDGGSSVAPFPSAVVIFTGFQEPGGYPLLTSMER